MALTVDQSVVALHTLDKHLICCWWYRP